MADKLLVRAYNVDVGDCIYCRIPKAKRRGGQLEDFHILIDCGSKGSPDKLEAAVEHLKSVLPNAGGGKKRLDLLIVTHEHEDHIKGFDPDFFADIKIENIWMSVAMNLEHPQAGRSLQLRGLAMAEMRSLAAQNLAMSPELQDLVSLYSINNEGAMEALRDGLPEANGIEAKYVHAGMTNADLGIALENTKITVVGPENDIDRFYLGADADESLRGFSAASGEFRERAAPLAGPPPLKLRRTGKEPVEALAETGAPPGNISLADFHRLQSRMLSNALAFADLESKVTNNTSVVLLIEWKGKRLLFVGDAEWDARFKEGKSNGAWNTMWKQRKALLDAPIDFLKIGHHGSTNSTPWIDGHDGDTEPSLILDAILPIPSHGAAKAKAIVSTARKNYPSIPSSELLVDIGQRVGSVRNYADAFEDAGIDPRDLPLYTQREKEWLSSPQPLRTDYELLLNETTFVDVDLEA